MRSARTRFTVLLLGCGSAAALFVMGIRRAPGPPEPPEPPVETAPDNTLRPAPAAFTQGSYMPDIRESEASGSIDLGSFSAGRDLVFVDDNRVWWESDHDRGDTECDHTVHRALREPLERVIELVAARGARLKVQDAYRPTLIHSSRSLHKEGRAIDLTCDDMPLEELAKLCWQAGFDWVYYEKGRAGNGPHIHASVRSRPD